MSFWSRLTDIVDSTWDGVYAGATGAVGLVWDLAGEAIEPAAEADISGVGRVSSGGDNGTAMDVITRRIPQIANGLIGPESGLGTTIGALPEAVRGPARTAVNGLEWAYREGIGEPISTVLTVGSLAESDIYNAQTGLRNPFSKQIWKDAYKIAQHRSPGQALALTFTDDVLSEREVARAQGSDWYRAVSGTFDATLRMSNLSPDVFLGHTITGVRLTAVTKPVSPTGVVTAAGKTVDRRSLPLIGVQRPFAPQVYRVPIIDPDSAAVGARVQRVVADMKGRNAAEIADRHFRDHPFRAEISSLLADAPTDLARTEVMKGLLGSGPAVDRLGRESAALANRLERIKGRAESYAALGDSGFVVPGMNLKDEVSRLSLELDELYPEQLRLERANAAYGTLQQVPRYRATAVARANVTRSDVFQTSRYAAPLRVVYSVAEKLPHRLVNLEDPQSDVQVERLLRRAELPTAQADILRSEYMAATTADARQLAYIHAEEAAVRAITAKHGIDPDAVGKILDSARDGRGRAIAALKSRVYDGEGRSRIQLRGESESVDIPLFVSQQANVLPVVDIAAVERAAREVAGRGKRFTDAGMEIADDLLGKFYELWKPAVLLRPAWPIRVGIDEHMRIMAKLGFLADIGNTGRELWTAARNGVKRDADAARRLPGSGPVVLAGYEFDGAFGRPGEGANIFQRVVSSRASFEALAGRYERGFLERMRRRPSGEWRSILPDEPSYGAAWENAVNRQIGSDAVGRQLLEGKTDEQIVAWLRGTAEGQKYARRLPTRARHPERWLPAAREQVESYLPTTALREKALAGNVKADDLVKAVGDAGLRPVVHGEILAQIFGNSIVNETYEKIIQTMYDALGRAPTDVLARQPYADAVYRAEVTRLFRLYEKQIKDGGTAFDEALAAYEPIDLPPPGSVQVRLPAVSEVNRMGRENRLSDYSATLHRETSLDRFLTDFATSRDMAQDRVYFANRPDLALGQGANKGVRLEFDPGELRGFVNTSKPGWEAAYREGQVEIVGQYNRQEAYHQALRRVTIPRGVKGSAAERYRLNSYIEYLEGQGWRRAEGPDLVLVHPDWQPRQQVVVPPGLPVRVPQTNEALMRAIEAKARRAMVHETRGLLYDLAEQSEMAHVLRFVAPFFSAWQEVLGVWAGIAVENPAYVARVLKAYGAPYKSGGVQTDEQGNKHAVIKLPDVFQKIPGLEDQGAVRLNVSSLNMVLNGPPGVGPTVQIPVAYVLRDRPDLASSGVVETFIFPYGIPKSTAQALLPPTFKRLVSASREEDDTAYLNAKLRIWQTKMLDVSLGKRPAATPEQLLDEAGREAKKFFLLRAFVSWVSPVGVGFDSPYQPYIDAYRKLREADPASADEAFLTKYGDEFFPLTQSLTKAVEGVPATVEGFASRKEHAELIGQLKDKALIRLVIGAEGAGEFSRAVYENQLDEGQRLRLTEEEFMEGPGIRLGWIRYRQGMDTINAELLARGLPNMQVKAAADLRATKKALIRKLAQEYPDWYSAYSVTDRSHWSNRLADLRTIAADPLMQARPEIRGLNEYLRLRGVIAAELKSREAHSLTATANTDVAAVWDAAVDQIALANPAFADLRNRWLENDPVWLSEDLGKEAAA